jgi:hypothetical protein
MTAATLTATTTSSTETRLNNAGGKEIKSAAGFDLFPRPPRTAYDLYQVRRVLRQGFGGRVALEKDWLGWFQKDGMRGNE